ncbi:MAG: hypothetical protein AAFR92_04215 [Pseudomonadota bacterium]
MLKYSVFSLALLTASCAPTEAASNTLNESCANYFNSGELLNRYEDTLILLGETHGTDQSEEAALSLICEAKRTDTKIAVGIEMPIAQSSSIGEAVANDGDTQALKAAADLIWSGQDGRGSSSKLRFFQKLQSLDENGEHIHVFAFDADPFTYTSTDERETAMAKHLDTFLLGWEGPVIVLTGDFHARKIPLDLGEVKLTPMAMKVTARDVSSFIMLHDGGEAWLHISYDDGQGNKVVEIGENEMYATAPAGLETDKFIFKPHPADPDESAYDGYFNVGELTASPPAFPDLVNSD